MFRVSEKMLIRISPFGMDLISGIYYLATPLLLIELRANPVELGLLGTIIAAFHMGLSNVTGRLSDRLGRRRLIVTAPAFFVTSCTLMIFAREVWFILALSVLNGICLSMFWPTFQAWIADRRDGADLARDIGIFNMSWTAASLTGPVVSGFLYSLYPRLPFLVAVAIGITVILVTRASLYDKPVQPSRPPQTEEKEPSDWHRHFLYAIWLANFANWFLIGNARYQFPKLARELDTPSSLIGLLMGCISFAQFLGFFILRKSHFWHFNKSSLFGAQALGGVAALLIFFSSAKVCFALALILIGLSCSITFYSSLYYAVHLMRKKGKGTGLHESIVGSGLLIGPLLGGLAADTAGLRAPYLLCVAVLCLAVVAEWVLLKRQEARRPLFPE